MCRNISWSHSPVSAAAASRLEHNLDVIAAAEWIIDLGPEGGKNGGFLVAEGTPEAIAARGDISHTGIYLSKYLSERLSTPTFAAASFA